MNVDLEVGGRDQLLKMLCGRGLMKTLRKKEKFVLTIKLLADPAGKKMGKSEGNMIGLTEAPEKMYGAIMAWPDSSIVPGFELLTGLPKEEVSQIIKLSHRDAKARLAKEIVSIFHDKRAGAKAEEDASQPAGIT